MSRIGLVGRSPSISRSIRRGLGWAHDRRWFWWLCGGSGGTFTSRENSWETAIGVPRTIWAPTRWICQHSGIRLPDRAAGSSAPAGSSGSVWKDPKALVALARVARSTDCISGQPLLGVQISFEVFFRDKGDHPIGRHFYLGNPQQRVEDYLAKGIIAPVGVAMPSSKTKTAPSVWSLPYPHHDFGTSLVGYDMGVGSFGPHRALVSLFPKGWQSE